MKRKQIKASSSSGVPSSTPKKQAGMLKKGKKTLKKRGQFLKVNNSGTDGDELKGRRLKKTTHKTLRPGGNKRKFDGDSVGHKKKIKLEKQADKYDEDGKPKLEKKDLKSLRRKKKKNYELTISLIKKYDGLRR